jgi:hypothetical protein
MLQGSEPMSCVYSMSTIRSVFAVCVTGFRRDIASVQVKGSNHRRQGRLILLSVRFSHQICVCG